MRMLGPLDHRRHLGRMNIGHGFAQVPAAHGARSPRLREFERMKRWNSGRVPKFSSRPSPAADSSDIGKDLRIPAVTRGKGGCRNLAANVKPALSVPSPDCSRPYRNPADEL